LDAADPYSRMMLSHPYFAVGALLKRPSTLLVLLGAGLGASHVEAKPYKGAEVYTQMQY
jgi:hypothetical protein